MRGVLSLIHIPVAARAAHRVINVIVFIFLPFFFVLPLLIFYLFYLLGVVILFLSPVVF